MWHQLVLSMTLADWLTIGLATWAGLKVWQARPERMLRRNRRRELVHLGLTPAAVIDRCRVLLAGTTPTVADELSWLADQLDLPPSVGFPFR
jgi:hypothetical protein